MSWTSLNFILVSLKLQVYLKLSNRTEKDEKISFLSFLQALETRKDFKYRNWLT